jgi:hypothetical protein
VVHGFVHAFMLLLIGVAVKRLTHRTFIEIFLTILQIYCIFIQLNLRASIKAQHANSLSNYATRWYNKMKRVFKTRHFSRWMRKTELTDSALCRAVAEMTQGLIDADLGGGVVKKRVGLAGQGKRGGARTLVATNKGSRWFFVYGFEKNDRANITNDELAALKEIAEELLARTGLQLDTAVQDGSLQEICDDNNS